MADDLTAIADEAQRLEESATQSAQNQFEQAKMWRGINIALGVPASVLAAIAGGTALANVTGRVPAGVMALVAAGFSGALTTLNAGRRVTQAHSAANAYLILQTDLRQFRTLDLPDLDYTESRSKLEELTGRMREINTGADIPSRLAYALARRNVNKGRQTYEVDAKPRG
jgi:hypothetical protein